MPKGIFYFNNNISSNNYNYSYVHAVLQSLSTLECSKEFLLVNNFNNLDMQTKNNLSTTIELYNLLSMLYKGHQAFSQDILKYYANKTKMLNFPQTAYSSDPYHFLYYLLELIHYENNRSYVNNYDFRQLFNQNIQNQGNDEYMFNLLYNCFKLTQNSFISIYFYNIEKKTTSCLKCGFLYYYSINKIITFNVDLYRMYRDQAYPNKKGSNLSIDECFQCYIGDWNVNCNNCGLKAITHKKLCCTTKVLFINLQRFNHKYMCDINFPLSLNLINYYSISRSNYLPFIPFYNLKAIISYNNMRRKYFADCFVSNNNNNGWYRFLDNEVNMLINPNMELYNFEPQLLVYELANCKSLQLNPFLMTHKNLNNFQRRVTNSSSNFNPSAMMSLLKLNQNDLFIAQNQNQNMINVMNDNDHINNNQNNNNNNNTQVNFNPMSQNIAFGLKFICVPEIGDQSETPLNRITAQVLSSFTFEKAVTNFFIKLIKPREAIKRFLLNGVEISQYSKSTLASLNIDHNTIIKAIKADNFDQLKLENN